MIQEYQGCNLPKETAPTSLPEDLDSCLLSLLCFKMLQKPIKLQMQYIRSIMPFFPQCLVVKGRTQPRKDSGSQNCKHKFKYRGVVKEFWNVGRPWRHGTQKKDATQGSRVVEGVPFLELNSKPGSACRQIVYEGFLTISICQGNLGCCFLSYTYKGRVIC